MYDTQAPVNRWIDEERACLERWGFRARSAATVPTARAPSLPPALEVWHRELGRMENANFGYRTDLRLLLPGELTWEEGWLVIATDGAIGWALKDDGSDRVWYEGSVATARFFDHPNDYDWTLAHESTQHFLTAFDRYACLSSCGDTQTRRIDRRELVRLLAAIGARSSHAWSYPSRGEIHVAPEAIVHVYPVEGVSPAHLLSGDAPGELEIVAATSSSDLLERHFRDGWVTG